MITKIFPCTLILMDLGAAIVYLCHGDYRLFTYWISASVLTVCVTI